MLPSHIEPNAALRVTRWETVLSDVGPLSFDGLADRGDTLTLTVQDEGGRRYEVAVEQPDVYRVAGEHQLIHYWSVVGEGAGPTLRVTGARWTEDLELREVYAPGAQHFLVVTDDVCLEVATTREPTVRAL